MAIKDWKWYGFAGHFICVKDCQFHLTTKVGDKLISTVGDYQPYYGIPGRKDERTEIAPGRFYETMVFDISENRKCEEKDCGCDLPVPNSWTKLDFNGYNTAGEAQAGHLELCLKYDKEIK
jgi:hypothetical protein